MDTTILVASPHKYSEILERANASSTASDAAWHIGDIAGKFNPLGPAGDWLLKKTTGKGAGDHAKDAAQAILGSPGRGLTLPRYTPEKARSNFRFDHGHPIDGAVYLQNPCMPKAYFLPAIANERMAQEKFAAFIEIVSALGARRIELMSAEAVGMSAGGNLQAPIPQAAAQIGIHARIERDGSVSRQAYLEYAKPGRKPYFDKNFQPWLDSDPVLRSLVKTRLDSNVSTFNVQLTFKESLSAAASVAAKMADYGLEVGGKYQQFGTTSWSFAIEYWPK